MNVLFSARNFLQILFASQPERERIVAGASAKFESNSKKYSSEEFVSRALQIFALVFSKERYKVSLHKRKTDDST